MFRSVHLIQSTRRFPPTRSLRAPRLLRLFSSVSSSMVPSDTFLRRHVGPSNEELQTMAKRVGYATVDALIDDAIPKHIRFTHSPAPKHANSGDDCSTASPSLPPPMSESEALASLRKIASKNKVLRTMIGGGYYDTLTPPVILRCVLENPHWYTPYTPYQAEISQGRMQSLMNYQTMVSDLTGLPWCNSSLLDEASAAGEAMYLSFANAKRKLSAYFVSERCHPQTVTLLRARAKPLGIELHVGDEATFDFNSIKVCGALLQYPDTYGNVDGNIEAVVANIKKTGAIVAVATDLLALTMLKPPGEFGADVALGNSQRFGVPLNFGGPHAAFFATNDKLFRLQPGRMIGFTRDAQGSVAFRMALQTREQHIRRERATSNICTAQALLANVAAMYAVYHGPKGLRDIAERVHALASALAHTLVDAKYKLLSNSFFDTISVDVSSVGGADRMLKLGVHAGYNFRYMDPDTVGIAVDETTTIDDIHKVLRVFLEVEEVSTSPSKADALLSKKKAVLHANPKLLRSSDYLTAPVFNQYSTETEMMRYITRLERRDVGLTTCMIPLGSCTMKLNAASEMMPITWPEFTNIHPFAPLDQANGYMHLIKELEHYLAGLTGFHSVSLQPNSGATGEYAGLMCIRSYHQSKGEYEKRDVCLIPSSAHGTNPASAVVAGMRVVVVATTDHGYIDVDDLKAKLEANKGRVGALMMTYPSTFGVFEERVIEVIESVHEHGALVYMDGANMNAQVGLTAPGRMGADVCHLNLHKTFCIPHGGGGPGVGPIGVAKRLAPFLPNHPLVPSLSSKESFGNVAAAPWGSAAILPISYQYIRMMGLEGLSRATKTAIVSANYMAARLSEHYKILYTNDNNRCAHEFIIDLRPLEKESHVAAEDVAKRLQDYGFHAPTLAFPVPGTLMVEPTESESLYEIDRFCEAMIQIRAEIDDVVRRGATDASVFSSNILKNAPHTLHVLSASEWNHYYTREQAAFPMECLRENKIFPYVGRIDNVWGDLNLATTLNKMKESPKFSNYKGDRYYNKVSE